MKHGKKALPIGIGIGLIRIFQRLQLGFGFHAVTQSFNCILYLLKLDDSDLTINGKLFILLN